MLLPVLGIVSEELFLLATRASGDMGLTRVANKNGTPTIVGIGLQIQRHKADGTLKVHRGLMKIESKPTRERRFADETLLLGQFRRVIHHFKS